MAVTVVVTKVYATGIMFGYNLGIMREHVASESVDLIYLDSSFNSNVAYKYRKNPKTCRGSIVLKSD